jgi:hypothetical protein
MGQKMTDVFISHKRGDDDESVNTLCYGLRSINHLFGHGQVFLDTSDIKPGEEWPNRLQAELNQAQVLIVAIGEGWLERIDDLVDEADWVRREIMYALDWHKVILPVTLGNTSIPRAESLPTELQPFLKSQAFSSLNTSRPDNDLNAIATRLREAPREYRDRRARSAMNGLKGVLNLAWRYSKDVAHKDRNLEFLARRLIPDYFVDDETLRHVQSANGDQDFFRFDDVDRNYPTINPDNSLAIRVLNRTKLQIGVLESPSQATLAFFEQYRGFRDHARVLLIEYRYDDDFTNFEIIRKLMEADLPPELYRLPYRSIFDCKVYESSFNQSLRPFGGNGNLDSAELAKLFKIEWLGTRALGLSHLNRIRAELQRLQRHFTIIHGVEFTPLSSEDA